MWTSFGVWASSEGVGLKLTSNWLPTPTSSEPSLLQLILWARQVVAQKFCGWDGVPVPPLEALCGYKRWPVQTLYPPLQGVLTGTTLIDSSKFPLYSVSALPLRCLQLLLFLLGFFPLLMPSVPILTWTQSTWKKSILFLFPKEILEYLLELFLLLSLSELVDCWVTILYLITNIHL